MSTPIVASSPATKIIELTWGYAPTLIVEAAIHHGVFNALDSGPLSLTEMCAHTNTSQRGLRVLLNALVALELVVTDSSGRFLLTPTSKALLVSTKPDFQGGLLRQISTRVIPVWLGLKEAVRTGQPVIATNQEDRGASFFKESVLDLFSLNYPATQVLAWALGLPKSATPVRILDVAAGSGVWGIGLAKASPQAIVVAVDWDPVLAVARETANKYKVDSRFTFIAGDIHQVAFGEAFDLVVLGEILHSEGEIASRALLAKVFAALKSGGTIAISEFLVNSNHTGPLVGTILAVAMLLHTEAGDTFSFEQISAWLLEIGFVDPRPLKVPAPSPLILATKP